MSVTFVHSEITVVHVYTSRDAGGYIHIELYIYNYIYNYIYIYIYTQ